MSTADTSGPNLQEIAQAAGMSVSAVSMALANHPQINPQTRQRIRELSRTMGYRRRPRAAAAKRQAAEERAMRLGFVLLGSRFEDEAHTYMLSGCSSASAELGHRMEVLAIPGPVDAATHEQVLQFSRGLDGLLLSGLVEPSLLRELETIGLPHVVIGHVMGQDRHEQGQLGQIVTGDDVQMGYAAATLLIARGHRKIGFVCETMPPGLWNDRWRRGYRIALMEHNLPFDPGWVQVAGQRLAGAAPAAQAVRKLPEPPTAFIVPDARVAASFLAAMQQLGQPIAPRDLVFSAPEPLRQTYQLHDYAWIGYDHQRLTAVALRQLAQLCRQSMPCITEVVVPFIWRQAPELDARA